MVDGIVGSTSPSNLGESLCAFIIDRLVIQLRDEGYQADVLQAVQGGRQEDNIGLFIKRAETTRDRISNDLVSAYRRAANILEKAKDWQRVSARPYAEEADKSFAKSIDKALPKISDMMTKADFGKVFDLLGELRDEIDNYFDAVMVNSENLDLRNQRLSMLADFVDAVNQVADLSKLEG